MRDYGEGIKNAAESLRFADNPNADQNPVDYQFRIKTVTRTEPLPVHLAPGSGFLIRLRKK